MKEIYTDEEIRRRCSRWLDNKRITKPEWDFVTRQGCVDDFRDALRDLASAGEVAVEESLVEIEQRAAQIVDDLRVFAQNVVGTSPGGTPPRRQRLVKRSVDAQDARITSSGDEQHEILLSYAAASLAAQDPEVRAFRNLVCGVEPYIGLLEAGTWMDTAEWIEAQWHGDQGGHDPLPEGPQEEEWPMLQYAAYPNEQWNVEREAWESAPGPLRSLRVVPCGVLDQLRQLAARLASEYRWDQAAAVNFILTDDAPLTPSLSATVEWCERVPALSRIVLVVDPAVPPQRLRAQYQAMRKKIFGEEFPRKLDEKTLLLAARTAGRTATSALSELMDEWNREMMGRAPTGQKIWAYRDKERFARDRRRAEQRVLRPGYHPPMEVTSAANPAHEEREEE